MPITQASRMKSKQTKTICLTSSSRYDLLDLQVPSFSNHCKRGLLGSPSLPNSLTLSTHMFSGKYVTK